MSQTNNSQTTNQTQFGNPRACAATKTYFWVSKNTSDEIKNGNTDAKIFTFHFPTEFIASRNQKWIIVEECKATFKTQLVGDVIMHADFIHRDHFLDYACCFINEEANRNTAKYEYDNTIDPTFKLWFTDLHGEMVDMDAFVFRALLIY